MNYEHVFLVLSSQGFDWKCPAPLMLFFQGVCSFSVFWLNHQEYWIRQAEMIMLVQWMSSIKSAGQSVEKATKSPWVFTHVDEKGEGGSSVFVWLCFLKLLFPP